MGNTEIRREIAPTHWVRIYMSGPMAVAEQIIRGVTSNGGLCVTVEPAKFIYRGGEETGFVVGLVNYPRFPEPPQDIEARARDLMYKLLEGTFQDSALLMTPNETEWISKRRDGK